MKQTLLQILNKQIVRFGLIAGLNTLFGYGIFALLIYSGLHYTLAVFISTVVGVLFNFKTYGILVFKSSKNSLIFRFIGVYAIVYLFNISGICVFERFAISNYFAAMIMLVPVGLLSFVLNKLFVYKTI